MSRDATAVRLALLGRLHSRRPEIEQAILTRVHSISDPGELSDPIYADSLRAAVSVALDYGLAAIEHGGEEEPLVPDVLLRQARLAARHRISIDVVLRRYFAGYSLLGDFLVEEVERGDFTSRAAFRALFKNQAVLFDHLLNAIGSEYALENAGSYTSHEERRIDGVQRLLDGEPAGTTEFTYDFTTHHLGVVGIGENVASVFRELASTLDRRLLLVRPSDDSVWGWLGGGRTDPSRVLQELKGVPRVAIAVGEPAPALVGWRLTHQQAQAALPIALRRQQPVARYGDVVLLAAALHDRLLSSSLTSLYLAPLREERDAGAVAKKTLRAYFSAGRNVSSAAALLEVNRNTVSNRLRAIERRVGWPLGSFENEMETALQLEDLEAKLPTDFLAGR